MLDEVLLLAALRNGDLDPRAVLLGERLGEQLVLLDVVAEQDQLRHRLVVVELCQERAEHGGAVEALVGAREIGAVAPVLPGAEEEDLDDRLAALLVAGEEIGLLEGPRIDALRALDMGEGREAVAIDGGGLEIEPLGRLLHLARHLLANRLASSRQEGGRLVDEVRVVGRER